MTAKQLISMALAYKGMSYADLARSLGSYPQKIQARINTGKLSLEEWEQIGKAIGAKAEMHFIFEDGTTI